MSVFNEALKQAIEQSLKEIEAMSQNMKMVVVESTAIVLDSDNDNKQQKALPAPQSQQGSEGK